MPLTSLECQASELVKSDTCPRPTTGGRDLDRARADRNRDRAQEGRAGRGSVARPLRATAHPLCIRFAKVFGASGSEAAMRPDPEPEIHRVDPESGSTQEARVGIFTQTVGSTCEFWVNPVDFTVCAQGVAEQDSIEKTTVRQRHGRSLCPRASHSLIPWRVVWTAV
jgi:hypothetical protein